jgi:hypothetical protein
MSRTARLQYISPQALHDAGNVLERTGHCNRKMGIEGEADTQKDGAAALTGVARIGGG